MKLCKLHLQLYIVLEAQENTSFTCYLKILRHFPQVASRKYTRVKIWALSGLFLNVCIYTPRNDTLYRKRGYSNEYSREELLVETRVNFVVYIFVGRMRIHGWIRLEELHTIVHSNISSQKCKKKY